MARSERWWAAISLCLLACAFSAATVLASDLFVDSGQRLGNAASWSVALGDVDGDGDLDAAVANFDAGSTIWLNDGTGQFTDSGQRLGNELYEIAVLADFDGDDALDVLLGSWDQAAAMWWNDGNGTFTEGQTLSAFSRCMNLAVGDLNGNGLPDIFVATDERDLVLLNDGDRTFTKTSQRLGSSPTGGVALGDMDGDGDCDVVAASWEGPGYVWTNDGAGRFSQLSRFDAASLWVHGAVLADYEGDGDLDAFFAVNGSTPGGSVWLNDGTGRLTAAPFELGNTAQNGIAVADFDLDGYVDVAQAIGKAVTPSPSEVWLGEGDGFAGSSLRIGEVFAGAIAAGDLDGDGDIDLFLACLSPSEAEWGYQPHPNEVWINTTHE